MTVKGVQSSHEVFSIVMHAKYSNLANFFIHKLTGCKSYDQEQDSVHCYYVLRAQLNNIEVTTKNPDVAVSYRGGLKLIGVYVGRSYLVTSAQEVIWACRVF